jgi:hypothetical protein
MKTLSKRLGMLLFLAAAVLPAQAADDKEVLQSRVKAALNEMVQEVKSQESAEAKRETLERFIGKVERRAGWLETMPFIEKEQRAALSMLQGKFAGYQAELKGLQGRDRVADRDLDAFASFVQQDLEQAEVTWDDGGVYLSVGAIIIILLVLLLVT